MEVFEAWSTDGILNYEIFGSMSDCKSMMTLGRRQSSINYEFCSGCCGTVLVVVASNLVDLEVVEKSEPAFFKRRDTRVIWWSWSWELLPGPKSSAV